MRDKNFKSILGFLLVFYWAGFSIAQTAAVPQIDQRTLDSYSGEYQLTNDIILTVVREGEKLVVAVGDVKTELTAEAANKFKAKSAGTHYTFKQNNFGAITELLYEEGDEKLTAYRRAVEPEAKTDVKFKVQEVMIPMRDGKKLHTMILVPETITEPLPILMQRTPYSVDGFTSNRVNQGFPELIQDGYIFAFQDIRGRFQSEGEFVMNRPLRTNKNDSQAIDETTDTYDTIEWMLKNVSGHNGRVGIFGVSYPGWTAVMGAIDPHPAMKAASPQAAMGDTWMGDDFFHHGAFRLSYGFEYVYSLETSKLGDDFNHDRYDTYDWYLKLGSLSNANDKYFKGKLPTWENFIKHPTYDDYWKNKALDRIANTPRIPTLHVAGWWDQEDFYGAVNTYLAMEKNDTNNLNFFVAGPWNHGGWSGGMGDRLGKIQFLNTTGRYYRAKIQAPFFAHYLKDKGNFVPAEATTFETGSNEWKTYSAWPPKQGILPRNLYLSGDGRLSFEAPKLSTNDYDEYVSDPKHPVPYRPRPIQATYHPKGSDWRTWLVQDQRFVHNRPDVLSWDSEPLTEDLTISGQILANLFASTSGTDSDWVVKLIDVYPEEWSLDMRMSGYQLMVSSEILRGRYRKSFERPEPVKSNEVNAYQVDLRWADHTFKKGHRVMVQVQSTWFPLYDRNPQKYVENIFKAKDADYQTAIQRIFRNRQFPSHLVLPIKL